MNMRFLTVAFLTLGLAGAVVASAQNPKPAAEPVSPAQGGAPDQRAQAYYNVTMGHLYEQEFESSGHAEDAAKAIDFYKKAYAIDPASPEIGEDLAEVYFLAHRSREAINEAEELIRRNPNDIAARRLLARIYIRSLGDLTNSSEQQQTITAAIGQLREITRLDPSDGESALWLARLLRLDNKDDQAEQVLRALLVKDPQSKGAVEQLSLLLLDHNNAQGAISLLESFVQQAPSAELYDRLGDAYQQIQQPAKSEQAYRQAVAIEPDQAEHRRHLAQSLFEHGKYPDALTEYQRLVDLEPDSANNHLRISEIYRRLRQFDKAEDQILLAKKLAPGNLEVIYNEAAVYEAEEHYDQAVSVLSNAVAAVKAESEFAPARTRSLGILYQLLGQLYRDEQNYPAAINTFQEMVRLGPEEDLRARLLIIDTYRANRDLPHAFDEASKALNEHPKDRGLLMSQALLYGENKQPEMAAQSLQPLLENSPSDLEIYSNLAQVYTESRRFGDAEKAVRSAEKLAQNPSDKETVGFLLGGMYERQKKYEQAEQAFKGVLAINPQNAPTLNYFGYMLADRGVRLDEAADMLRRALDLDPNNAAYLDSMGWIFYKQNNLGQAESYLRKAVERDSHDPTMLSHLGDVLAKSGHADQAAVDWWEKSLAEWHRTVPAEFEEAKVAELEQKISNVKRHIAQQKSPTAENQR
jgi:tetratricopeptide (TPR) repeat protein